MRPHHHSPSPFPSSPAIFLVPRVSFKPFSRCPHTFYSSSYSHLHCNHLIPLTSSSLPSCSPVSNSLISHTLFIPAQTLCSLSVRHCLFAMYLSEFLHPCFSVLLCFCVLLNNKSFNCTFCTTICIWDLLWTQQSDYLRMYCMSCRTPCCAFRVAGENLPTASTGWQHYDMQGSILSFSAC